MGSSLAIDKILDDILKPAKLELTELEKRISAHVPDDILRKELVPLFRKAYIDYMVYGSYMVHDTGKIKKEKSDD